MSLGSICVISVIELSGIEIVVKPFSWLYSLHILFISLRVLNSIDWRSSTELLNIQAPLSRPVVAVYPSAFTDQTGQRKSNSEFALFSSAITQAPSNLLIRTLKHASNGEFFRVVERVGLDNLVKERQLIRSTREVYEGKEAVKLKPMLFAGLILEGGVVGYDSNTTSGGAGARYFGIGANTQYRTDQVTVSMRIVSVQTGEVLLSVATEKIIASHKTSADVFRFLDLGTKALEIEAGSAVNEPTNYAVRTAIEAAIVELVKQGVEKELWDYKGPEIDNNDNNKGEGNETNIKVH